MWTLLKRHCSRSNLRLWCGNKTTPQNIFGETSSAHELETLTAFISRVSACNNLKDDLRQPILLIHSSHISTSLYHFIFSNMRSVYFMLAMAASAVFATPTLVSRQDDFIKGSIDGGVCGINGLGLTNCCGGCSSVLP